VLDATEKAQLRIAQLQQEPVPGATDNTDLAHEVEMLKLKVDQMEYELKLTQNAERVNYVIDSPDSIHAKPIHEHTEGACNQCSEGGAVQEQPVDPSTLTMVPEMRESQDDTPLILH
jgi:hypothetical protein